MNKKIGIRELAAHMGMAVSTVSRAMNGSRDVSAETRQRILDEAQRLGYRPNQSGRSLRSGVTNAVAMTMRTDIGRTASGETFFMAISEGLQSVLSKAGIDLMILPCASDQDENEFLYRVVDRGLADAFIVSNIQRFDPRITYLGKLRVPFVALGNSETSGNYASLDLDFARVARESVDRLVKAGHRDIVLALTAQETYNNYIFLDGYRQGLAAADIPFREDLVLRLYDRISGGFELANSILAMRSRPTAALLIQETMAMGLYQGLRHGGVEPGRELAIIGLRENPVCRYLSPTLTSHRIDLKQYGIRLGEVVLHEIKRMSSETARRDDMPIREIWPMALVEAESG